MLSETLIEKFSKIKPKANEFYKQRLEITKDFDFDVSSSTYRVFWHTKQKPSIVFRNWAFSTIKNAEFFSDLLTVKNKSNFNVFHTKYSHSLAIFWKKEQDEDLDLPHKYKLFDLFLKSLSICEFHNETINEILVKYCNVPLDSITLSALDEITAGGLGLRGKSMGFVRTKEAYDKLQGMVLSICEKTGVTPLYFDFFSKNIGSQKQI